MDEQVFLRPFPEFFVGRRVLLLFGVFGLLHRPTLAVRCEYAHHLWPCSWPVPVEDTSTSPSVVSVAKDNDSNASARCCGICAFICAQKDKGVVGKSASLVTYVSSLATALRGTVECVRLFVHTQM